MSSVDNNQSLNAIMQKIGINPAEEKKRANGDQLGQEDFLKLMTTHKIRIRLRLWKMQNLLPRWLSSRQLQVSQIWGRRSRI